VVPHELGVHGRASSFSVRRRFGLRMAMKRQHYRQFERLFWIDGQIRRGLYPNTRKIADHFEVDAKTAQRDVESLRDRIHAPLARISQRLAKRKLLLMVEVLLNQTLKPTKRSFSYADRL